MLLDSVVLLHRLMGTEDMRDIGPKGNYSSLFVNFFKIQTKQNKSLLVLVSGNAPLQSLGWSKKKGISPALKFLLSFLKLHYATLLNPQICQKGLSLNKVLILPSPSTFSVGGRYGNFSSLTAHLRQTKVICLDLH